MRVKLKLYAGLQAYLPENSEDNAILLDIDGDSTVHQLIDRFKVPRQEAHLILLNGVYVESGARDKSGLLMEGDTLAVWPPVAGG